MNFLLPNPPLLPDGCANYLHCSPVDLISINGNHWRKILTIIAKLSAKPDEDWRIVRDQYIWQRVRLYFCFNDLPNTEQCLFIVGKTFDKECAIPFDGTYLGNEKHHAIKKGATYWVPYLDYRQFPNALIDTLRQQIYRDEYND